MLDGKTFLAVIPARKGSKRLPRKNILPLNGKPLICYTIEAALQSRYIDHTVVSSDDEEVLGLSREYDGVQALKRSVELATDTASSVDVILDTVQQVQGYDYIVLLQPTSPLRGKNEIDEAIELLMQKDADGIISVTQMEHSPLWSNTLPPDGNMGKFLPDAVIGKRSQDLPVYYRLNGAIYVCDTNRFVQEKSFFLKSNIFAFIMDKMKSVDIDEEIDLLLAETILLKRKL